jgi:hypothetical protein
MSSFIIPGMTLSLPMSICTSHTHTVPLLCVTVVLVARTLKQSVAIAIVQYLNVFLSAVCVAFATGTARFLPCLHHLTVLRSVGLETSRL